MKTYAGGPNDQNAQPETHLSPGDHLIRRLISTRHLDRSRTIRQTKLPTDHLWLWCATFRRGCHGYGHADQPSHGDRYEKRSADGQRNGDDSGDRDRHQDASAYRYNFYSANRDRYEDAGPNGYRHAWANRNPYGYADPANANRYTGPDRDGYKYGNGYDYTNGHGNRHRNGYGDFGQPEHGYRNGYRCDRFSGRHTHEQRDQDTQTDGDPRPNGDAQADGNPCPNGDAKGGLA